ncbi:MAG: LysR family transcriptional regulator [Myxococcota bacterium]
MDLADIQGLITLAEAGSLKGAAARLGMSRATLRRRIRALEKQLGVALTSAGESRVELTEAGAVCVDGGRRLLREARDLEAWIRAKGTQPSGRVRIALPIGSAGPEIALAIQHYATRYPELRFDLWFTADPVSALIAGADLAILFGAYPVGDWKVTSLGRLRLGAFAHREYLLDAGRPQSLDDLARHRLLHATSVPTPASTWPTWGGGALQIDPWLTTTDMDAVRQAVEARLGVGLLSDDLIGDQLEPVLVEVIGMNVPLWALTTPVGATLPRVRAVVEGARSFMLEEP